MNTSTQLNLTQLKRAKQARYNPLTGISDPKQIAKKLDAFDVGYLRDAVNIWDILEQRDDLIRTVVSKRKKSAGRQGWTVLPKNDLTPEQQADAKNHVAALEHFYNHLQCENALDTAEKGGFKLLVRQMMDAIGKRFAVHEIVWKIDLKDSGNSVRSVAQNLVLATFRFVPLSFFENTTGSLRFLESESAVTGTSLQPGAWMITAGEGLMTATSSAWILKHMALNDWLLYTERNGRPVLRGTTPALPDSDEWKALENAVHDVVSGNAVVHSSSDDIKVIDPAAGGHVPYPTLVERMDRMIAALWRGADLSTISRDRGYGASLQEKETCALEADDAEMLTETLNRYVDEWVIRYVFGEDAKPLAHVKVLITPSDCTTNDIQVDRFLLESGAELSLEETMSRYGRALPKPGEQVLKIGSAGVSPPRPRVPRVLSVPETILSYSESPHENESATMQASNSEDAHECEAHLTVSSRGSLGESTFSPGDSTLPPNPCSLAPSAVESAPENLSTGGPQHEASRAELPNEFKLLQADWVQLSPYGDFPHARGLQRLDRAAAEAMVAHFNSFRARLGRLFGGTPFYVGHPDLPNSSELADRKAYGWIMQIEARADGLYGQVKWSDAGLDLLKNAHYKYLSPYWEAKQVRGNGERVFQPVALVSVGLTNQPNIPVKPLANESAESTPNPLVVPANDPCLSVRSVLEKASAECPTPLRPCPAEPIIQPSNSPTVQSVPSCQSVVRPAPQLANMHTRSITENIAKRRREAVLMGNTQTARERIRLALRSKARLGLSYDEAWEEVKTEHREWFSNETD